MKNDLHLRLHFFAVLDSSSTSSEFQCIVNGVWQRERNETPADLLGKSDGTNGSSWSEVLLDLFFDNSGRDGSDTFFEKILSLIPIQHQ